MERCLFDALSSVLPYACSFCLSDQGFTKFQVAQEAKFNPYIQLQPFDPTAA